MNQKYLVVTNSKEMYISEWEKSGKFTVVKSGETEAVEEVWMVESLILVVRHNKLVLLNAVSESY